MKKFIKTAVIFAAMAFAVSCFVSCSDGDDGENSSPDTVTPGTDENQPGSGDAGSGDNVDWDDSSLKEAVLWVVGDSTVCDYIKEDGTHTDASYFYPR